jgi:hypothetical protein
MVFGMIKDALTATLLYRKKSSTQEQRPKTLGDAFLSLEPMNNELKFIRDT